MKELRWPAIIVDISQGGVRLKLQRRFERGTPLAIEMPGDGECDSYVVFAQVVHVRADDDGSWALGCKFISDLAVDEVQRLVDAHQHVQSSAKKDRDGKDRESRNGFHEENSKPLSDAAIATAIAPQEVQTPKRVLRNIIVEIDIGEAKPRRCLIKRLDVTKSWPLQAKGTLAISGVGRDGAAWSFQVEILRLHQAGEHWTLQSRLAEPAKLANVFHALRINKSK